MRRPPTLLWVVRERTWSSKLRARRISSSVCLRLSMSVVLRSKVRPCMHESWIQISSSMASVLLMDKVDAKTLTKGGQERGLSS